MRKNRRAFLTAAALALGCLGQSLQAATLTWDADGAGANTGGAGVWNTTNAFWTANGTTYVAWPNGGGDNAVFGSTAGVITLGATLNVNSLIYNVNGYTLDLAGGRVFTLNGDVLFGGSGLTVTFTDSDATAGSFSVITPSTAGPATGSINLTGNATLNFSTAPSAQSGVFGQNIVLGSTTQRLSFGVRAVTLSGQISGSGVFTQPLSQGQIILAGNNTITGAITLSNASGLVAASDTAFGTSSGITVSGATTLGFKGDADGAISVGAIPVALNAAAPVNGLGMIHNYDGMNSFAGNITGVSPARTYSADAASQLTLSGIISHSRGFTKFGAGTIVLTGANTFGNANVSNNDNATSVLDGTLRLDFNQASVSSDIINNGNTFGPGSNQFSELVLGGGALEVKGKSGATNSQKFKDRATAAAVGLGFRINPGASAVRVDQNGAANVLVSLGRISWRQIGGTMDLTLPTGTQTSTNGITVGTSGNINNVLGGFATVGATDWASTGLIGSTTPITPLSTYAADAWAAGNNTNVTTSSAPPSDSKTNSLRFNNSSANTLTLSGTNTITSGGILVTSNVGANDSIITGGTLAGSVNPGTSAYVTGNYGSDLIVHQYNTAGALKIDSVIADPAAPAGRNATAASGSIGLNMATNTRDLYVGMLVSGAGIQPGTTITGISSDTIATISLATTAALSATPITFTGVSGLTKTGPGVLELTKADTYSSATNLNGGVLKLSNSAALGNGNLALHGGVIGLTSATSSFTRSLGTGVGSVQFLGTSGFAAYGTDVTVNLGNSSTPSQVIWNSASFVPTLSTLILNTDDATGMVEFKNPIRILATGQDQSPINRTIQVGNGTSAVDARLSGAITDQAGIIKTGNGALELTGANTYTGVTNVNAGTLIISGTHTSGDKYTIGDGTNFAALSGTGSTASAVTVKNAAVIAPGNSVGTISTGAFTLESGASLLSEVDFPNDKADQVLLPNGGNVTLAGNLQLQYLGLSGPTVIPSHPYVLIHVDQGKTGTVSGQFANITPPSNPFVTFTVDYAYAADADGVHNDVAITFSPGSEVPEPSAVVIVGLSVLLGLKRRGRRSI